MVMLCESDDFSDGDDVTFYEKCNFNMLIML